MVVQVLGYRNGVGVNKNTGEQYRYVNTYVAFPADSVEGLQTEKLFMKVKDPLYLIPGHYYELETDMYFFNGQAQVRPCGFKEISDFKGF